MFEWQRGGAVLASWVIGKPKTIPQPSGRRSHSRIVRNGTHIGEADLAS
jgi:hypothetical protein